MIKRSFKPYAIVALLVLAGCASLEPTLPVAQPSIAADWPIPPSTGAGDRAVADIGWRDFFSDAKLKELIARALANNRDLRVAALNVERARALYRVQDTARYPSVALSSAATRNGGNAAVPDTYSASVGITAFEIDLFGRINNLSQSALSQYFALEQGRRVTQLALIAEIANVYLTLAADQELRRVARATLQTQEASFALTEKRHELGAVSGLDLSQARTLVETARADAARFAGQVATDTNALTLLVGAPVEAALYPEGFAIAVSGIAPLPAGLPSQVLLRRPDVLQAEYALKSTNANIGAARAAFFPSISLTGRVGLASNQLSDLFSSAAAAWSFSPQINLPIFQGERLNANLGVATADRNITLARYEKAIQTGFREVADALALSRTLADRRAAQQALLDAATRSHVLSRARYDAGRDSYLVLLDAQRSLYAAQQGLIAAQLAEQANRVTLYKVLGGGWQENNP